VWADGLEESGDAEQLSVAVEGRHVVGEVGVAG